MLLCSLPKGHHPKTDNKYYNNNTCISIIHVHVKKERFHRNQKGIGMLQAACTIPATYVGMVMWDDGTLALLYW